MLLHIEDTSEVGDEGTVIVLEGFNDEGDLFFFATDRRPALDIIAAVQAGEVVTVEVEPWQLLGALR